MKLGALKAFAHNIGDSLGSGLCLMIGVRDVDIFAEAGNSKEGFIEVDFLSGDTSGGAVSENLKRAIQDFRDALPKLAHENGVEFELISNLQIRFGTRPVHGRRMCVKVEDKQGRTAQEWYYGSPARRIRPAPGEHLA